MHNVVSTGLQSENLIALQYLDTKSSFLSSSLPSFTSLLLWDFPIVAQMVWLASPTTWDWGLDQPLQLQGRRRNRMPPRLQPTSQPITKTFSLQNLSRAFGCYLFHVCKFNWDFIFRLIPLPTEALRKSTLRCVCYSIVSPRAVTKGLPGGKLVHN